MKKNLQKEKPVSYHVYYSTEELLKFIQFTNKSYSAQDTNYHI